MNWPMAKEVGLFTYPIRRLLWRFQQMLKEEHVPFRLPHGAAIRLPLHSPFAADVYCTGGYVDWGSEQLLLRYLDTRPKAICIDVGANMGYYSCLLSRCATEVIAFEPDPRNHLPLRAQGLANLVLVPQAVSNAEGIATFDVSSESTVSHLCVDASSSGQIQVATTTLDAYWTTHLGRREVSAIKMDVEGFEILCLLGAGALADAMKPVFLIEFGMGNGMPNSIEALEAFLTEHGYELAAMIRRPAGFWGFRTALESVNARDLPKCEFKMLFLVPQGNPFFREQMDRGFEFETIRRARQSLFTKSSIAVRDCPP